MIKQNLYHLVPAGPKPPKKVYCLVEVPKGASNKYEFNIDFGAFVLDRVLYEAVFFPTEYGIIPQTWNKTDGDPLDVMVLSSFPTFPGCLITCRPIGVIRINDSGEEDNKIIAVPEDDPRFADINDLNELPPHSKKEIKNFWENYVELQPNKKIKVEGWSNKEAAWEIIQQAIQDYQKKFKV